MTTRRWSQLYKLPLFLLLLLPVLLAPGCDDNPADPGGQAVCEHVDADGFVVEKDGQTVLHQWEGVVTGEIEVDEGIMTDAFEVFFLDEDSVRTRPGVECVDHSLSWTVVDSSVAQVLPASGQRWGFRLEGRSEGETSVRLLVNHGDHTDFTSLPFEVHVHHHDGEHAEPAGVILRSEGTDLASQIDGVVTGEVAVEHDETTPPIDVVFVDEDGDEFTIDDPDFEFRWAVSDTNVAQVVNDSAWSFRIEGRTEGMTSIQIVVWHDGHADFTSQPLEIHVEEHGHEHLEPEGLVLRDGGSEVARVEEGVVSGSIELVVGATSPTLAVSFLAADGDEFTIDDPDFEMDIQIDDPVVASVAATGTWSFEVSGETQGQTTLRVAVVHDGHTDFTSPDIPVTVASAPSFDSMIVTDGEEWVATDDFNETGVSGTILVPTGSVREGLRARFPTSEGKYADISFQTLPGDHSLEWTVADPSIATLQPTIGDAFGFAVMPQTSGATTLTLRVLRGTEVVHTSGPLPVLVLDLDAATHPATVQFRLNGRTEMGLQDGALAAIDDQVCGSRVWMDRFEQSMSDPFGPLTDLIFVRLFDGQCERVDLSPARHRLAFLWSGADVARTTHHPEHIGEHLEFHVQGLSEGTAELTVVLIEDGDTALFVSPPLAVSITP